MRTALLLVIVSLATAAPASAQEAIYVIRHAERADQSPDSPLSTAGDARAASLARILRDSGITHIFTTELKRTVQTAAPSAAVLHVTSRIVPGGDTNALIAAVRQLAPTDRALVVGHSNTVPVILSGLGISSAITIGDSEFDNLFIVVPRKDGPPALLRLRY